MIHFTSANKWSKSLETKGREFAISLRRWSTLILLLLLHFCYLCFVSFLAMPLPWIDFVGTNVTDMLFISACLSVWQASRRAGDDGEQDGREGKAAGGEPDWMSAWEDDWGHGPSTGMWTNEGLYVSTFLRCLYVWMGLHSAACMCICLCTCNYVCVLESEGQRKKEITSWKSSMLLSRLVRAV